MRVKILKSEQDYEDACDFVYQKIQSTDKPINANSMDGEKVELLSLLIEKYEREHFPIAKPKPIEAIKFRMEQMNLRQSDVAPLFGGKTRTSEVLSGKRALSLKMISRLHQYLDIPLESLISEEEKYALESDKKQNLLKNESIRQTFNRRKRHIHDD